MKGRIDIIFANAGVGEFVPLPSVSEEHFDKLFNINVKGALFTVQKGLPLLNDGVSIILRLGRERKRHRCLWRLCSHPLNVVRPGTIRSLLMILDNLRK